MKRLLSFTLIGIIITLSFSLVSCKKQKEKFEDYSFDYFDTVTTITGFENTKDIFSENCKKIKEKLNEYHRLYNIYNKYDGVNNLCTLNILKGGKHQIQTVDKRIIDMLEFSKQIYDITEGKVNVAFGSVLSIWHNYRENGINHPEKAELPDIKELQKMSEYTNIDDIVIDKEKSTVYIKNANTSLDVGAIAKGYAVEETAEWMKDNGIEGYLLNVGGNVRCVGERPDGKGWTVGIENPLNDSEESYAEILSVSDMSLVTSGSYQRFYTVNGKNYHHIIDPETLYPSEKYLSVSVLSESSAVADALSTALFSMSVEDGKQLISSMKDIYVLWIMPDGEKIYSQGFKKYIKE